MKRKSSVLLVFLFLAVTGISSVFYGGQPPQGNTTGGSCRACHLPVNAIGSVSVSGLPTTFTPGQTYVFSLTINGISLWSRWGFSIAASAGFFGTGGGNTALNGAELSHANAPTTALQSSYSFTNLRWTAPDAGTVNVNFTFAGMAANGNGTTSGDNTYNNSFLSTQAVLPVKLQLFAASVRNNKPLLMWQTAQESNSSHFIIQRSVDNFFFNEIGRVEASGMSHTLKTYRFTDDDNSGISTTLFYRLAIIDKDASVSYSNIEKIFYKPASSYLKSIFPNPAKATDVLRVKYVSLNEQKLNLRLFDVSGRLISTLETNLRQGENTVEVKLPAGISGNYNLRLKAGDVNSQKTILVHRD